MARVIKEEFVLFQIFNLGEINVCIPSDNYYRERNDWHSSEIPLTRYMEIYTGSSKEDCLNFIKDDGEYYIATKYVATTEKLQK